MPLRFHWFLPTDGDGRDIVGGGHGVATGAAGATRPPSVKYLGQIARSAGITEFILSGYPHLEEAYWFGEGVLPILERRGLWHHPAPPRDAPQTVVPFTPTHPAATKPAAATNAAAQPATDRIAAS